YTTNTLPFTVTGYGGGMQPVITSVTGPTSLATGQQGTWTVNLNTGWNQYLTFSVSWGDQNVYPLTQAQSQSVFQTNTLTHTYYTPGTYTIVFTVSNNTGQSNTYTTSVVVGGSGTNVPSISHLSPQSGRVGTFVTIFGSGFSLTDNTVHFGVGGQQHVPSYNGTTITYQIPQYVSPCDLMPVGYTCTQVVQTVVPGSYPISVSSAGGSSSNSITFTVVQ
ncbi:MAG TPA: PKD domain-containing protein, partial [Candidatus Paceibacterota bacterium]